jgi:hypothetical protein
MSAATTSSLLAGRVPDGLADTAVPDLSLIFDQVAAIRMESQERTIQLRHRYLELMLEGLHDHRAEPLPGSPPTWAEINELLDLAGLASTSSNDPSNSVMRAGCMFRRTNCESPRTRR